MAAKYKKRIGFRVMMNDPDIAGPVLPDFLVDKVPMVKLARRVAGGCHRGQLSQSSYAASL